jgi:hypothetical protein
VGVSGRRAFECVALSTSHCQSLGEKSPGVFSCCDLKQEFQLIVYNNGEKPAKQKSFIMSICPAAHLEGQEVPSEWVDDKNKPIEFNVEFIYGKANVSDPIGKYLIKYQMAAKTRLIIPDRMAIT